MLVLLSTALASVWVLQSPFGLPGRPAGRHCAPPDTVTPAELTQAMSRHGAYDLTATTNAARFGAEVLLQLARRRSQSGSGNSRFLILQPEWFSAHRETAGVAYGDMSIAAREGYKHQQDILVDYDPGIKVRKGPLPTSALDVRIFWKDSGGAPSQYSYKDTMSVPKLKVYNERVVRFKLLEYEDMLVFDEVTGISIRPFGFLSGFFAVVGNPFLKENRIAVSRDQWQVMRGRVSVILGIGKTATATIEPGGKAHDNIPPGRADLRQLEDHLKEAIQVQYNDQCE